MVHLLLESLVALAQDEVVVNLPDERLVLINPQLRKERFSDLGEKGYRLKYCFGLPPGTKTCRYFCPRFMTFSDTWLILQTTTLGKKTSERGTVMVSTVVTTVAFMKSMVLLYRKMAAQPMATQTITDQNMCLKPGRIINHQHGTRI